MSYLQQEILSQPQLIADLLSQIAAPAQEIAAAIRAYQPTFVSIVARGTSDNAARYAQYVFGIQQGWVVSLATPSVHTLYGAKPRYDHALVIGISQSGQSEDVCQVIADARAQGALTLSITNKPQSPLAQAAQYHLDILAGEEKSVAATKSYTAQLAALASLAVALEPRLKGDLDQLPESMQKTLSLSERIPEWVAEYRNIPYFAALGRGYNYSTAHEISLKIKELCYIPGEEYSEADFRHGPIALVQADFPVIVVAPQGKTLEKQADLLAQLHAKGAKNLLITNAPEGLEAFAAQLLPIPAIEEWLSPLLAVIPGQVLAMNLAMARGYELDRPRGLQKVTITA